MQYGRIASTSWTAVGMGSMMIPSDFLYMMLCRTNNRDLFKANNKNGDIYVEVKKNIYEYIYMERATESKEAGRKKWII